MFAGPAFRICERLTHGRKVLDMNMRCLALEQEDISGTKCKANRTDRNAIIENTGNNK